MSRGFWKNFAHFWQWEIWHEPHAEKSPWMRGVYATCRVLSITSTVYKATNAASRAAALAFSSLLGLGPLVAIGVLITGIVLGDQYRDQAVHQLNRALSFVAPQVNQYEALDTDSDAQAQTNPKLVEMMNGFIDGARSSSAGVLGVLSLVLIVLLLFTSIETVFNEIWGVREGRGWLTRIVFYWTLVTLGAVLLFAAVALLGAGAFVNVFKTTLANKVYFGPELLRLLRWSLPLLAFLLLVGILTVFYRAIPNTRVLWKPAVVGAIAVAALLIANNFLAFLYLRRVILTKSLYGSLGVLPVLMFGLYVFWLFLLIGGQISYAVQNAHFKNSQTAWINLSESTRQRISLAVFLTICRRFQECLPPVSATHLATVVRVPSQILNECLNRLADGQLVVALAPDGKGPDKEKVYQPAKPLNRLSLGDFKRIEEDLGDDPMGRGLEALDPLIGRFDEASSQDLAEGFFAKTVEELISDNPFDHSRPPFRRITPS